MTADAGHSCAQDLRGLAMRDGVDIVISTQPPLVRGPYTTDSFVCPHGVEYWIELIGEQIVQWMKDGVP